MPQAGFGYRAVAGQGSTIHVKSVYARVEGVVKRIRSLGWMGEVFHFDTEPPSEPASASLSDEFVANWTAPADDGGRPVTGYVAKLQRRDIPGVEQSFTLGVRSQEFAGGTILRWQHDRIPNERFAAGFLANSSDVRYPVFLALDPRDVSTINIDMSVSSSSSATTAQEDDLSDQFENHWELDITYDGTTWSFSHDDFNLDTDEPYRWATDDAAVLARLAAATAAIGSNSGAVMTWRSAQLDPPWSDEDTQTLGVVTTYDFGTQTDDGDYRPWIAAINEEGTGPALVIDDFVRVEGGMDVVVPPPTATEPEAVTNLALLSIDSTVGVLRFSPPADNGGSAILSYEMQLQYATASDPTNFSDHGDPWTLTAAPTLGGSAGSFTFGDLGLTANFADGAYRAVVTATNGVGTGPSATSANAYRVSNPSPLDDPTDLVLTFQADPNVNEGILTLTWTPPPIDPFTQRIDDYLISWRGPTREFPNANAILETITYPDGSISSATFRFTGWVAGRYFARLQARAQGIDAPQVDSHNLRVPTTPADATLTVEVNFPTPVPRSSTNEATATIGGTATGPVAYYWEDLNATFDPGGEDVSTDPSPEVTYDLASHVVATVIRLDVTRGGVVTRDPFVVFFEDD